MKQGEVTRSIQKQRAPVQPRGFTPKRAVWRAARKPTGMFGWLFSHALVGNPQCFGGRLLPPNFHRTLGTFRYSEICGNVEPEIRFNFVLVSPSFFPHAVHFPINCIGRHVFMCFSVVS